MKHSHEAQGLARWRHSGSLRACAILAMVCAAQARAAGSAPLSFNWGDRLEGRVTAVETKSTSRGSEEVKAVYSLCASRRTKGYEVGFANLSMTTSDGKAMPEATVRLGAILTGLVPYANITHAGRFEGLRDFADLQAQARQMYRQELSGGADSQTIENLVERMTARKALESAVARSWQALVENWIGLSLAPGEVVKSRSPIMRDAMLQLPIAYDIEVSYLTQDACTGGATAKNCVRLRSIGVSDPASYAAAMEELRAQWPGSKSTLPQDSSVREELEVLTEPDTLRPHWARWTRSVNGTQGEKGHETSFAESDTTTMSFDYGPQAACKGARDPAK